MSTIIRLNKVKKGELEHYLRFVKLVAEFALAFMKREFYETNDDIPEYYERRRLRRLVPNHDEHERRLNPPRLQYFQNARQEREENEIGERETQEMATYQNENINAHSVVSAALNEGAAAKVAAAEQEPLERPARLLTPYDLGAGAV